MIGRLQVSSKAILVLVFPAAAVICPLSFTLLFAAIFVDKPVSCIHVDFIDFDKKTRSKERLEKGTRNS
jgi:hypothetical protein